MLKEILEQRGISVYKLSKEELYEGMEKKSTMFYLYNEGRNIILEYGQNRIQYLGPKNLVGFHRINRVSEHVVSVDCYFQDENQVIYNEEDYIDLQDVLNDRTVLDMLYLVVLGRPNQSEREIH